MKKYSIILSVALVFVGAAKAQFHKEGFEDVTLDSGQVMNGKRERKRLWFLRTEIHSK